MTIEKIKIKKEVLDWYNYLINEHNFNEKELIESFYRGEHCPTKNYTYGKLYDWWTEQVDHTSITLLSLGHYELELSPRDEIQKEWDNLNEELYKCTDSYDATEICSKLEGMKFVIERSEFKIKGVNAQ